MEEAHGRTETLLRVAVIVLRMTWDKQGKDRLEKEAHVRRGIGVERLELA